MIRNKRCATCEWFESAEDVEERWKAGADKGWSGGGYFYARCHKDVGGVLIRSDDWCSHWRAKE